MKVIMYLEKGWVKMRHHIIVKFKDKETLKELDHIKDIFKPCLEIKGIKDIEYHTSCIDLENRYHLMIVLVMDKDALAIYDKSEAHHRWKDEYSLKIDQKAIFDYE